MIAFNDDEKLIRRCYALAIRAGKAGYDTFGALLARDGEIIEEAQNTADYERGLFGHAEFNLVNKCAGKYSDAFLSESALYTSCAPCARCVCAIASLGVRDIVYGVSYEAFSRLTPGEYVYTDYQGALERINVRLVMRGPVLEAEGMRVFEYWGGEYRPLSELLAEMDKIKRRAK